MPSNCGPLPIRLPRPGTFQWCERWCRGLGTEKDTINELQEGNTARCGQRPFRWRPVSNESGRTGTLPRACLLSCPSGRSEVRWKRRSRGGGGKTGQVSVGSVRDDFQDSHCVCVCVCVRVLGRLAGACRHTRFRRAEIMGSCGRYNRLKEETEPERKHASWLKLACVPGFLEVEVAAAGDGDSVGK